MFERYAVFYTFDGPLAEAGAAWLGWDIARAEFVAQDDVAPLNLAAITERARKYGFHATIMAPFYRADTTDEQELIDGFDQLCATTAPVRATGLHVCQLGRLFALIPSGNDSAIKGLADDVVRYLDPFRAPLTPEDLKRRQSSRLTARQQENLINWGYPHVMEDFRFHVTLTSPLNTREQEPVEQAAKAHFEPHLPSPFEITHLTLVGADSDGMFREITRTALSG